jgi:hypothetical protein
MKVRKKPVVVEAVQYLGGAVPVEFEAEWQAGRIRRVRRAGETTLVIETLTGDLQATAGDWLIRGVSGDVYPCKPDIFAITYEPV